MSNISVYYISVVAADYLSTSFILVMVVVLGSATSNSDFCIKNSFIHVNEDIQFNMRRPRFNSAPPDVLSEDGPPAGGLVVVAEEMKGDAVPSLIERDDVMMLHSPAEMPSGSEIYYTVFISPACERRQIHLAPGTTTLMVRNIPTRFTSVSFLRILDECGFRSTFDFFYLPMDFRTGKNMGYAFLNFLDYQYTCAFANLFHGRRLRMTTSTKVIEISASRRQGLVENVALFKASDLLGSLSLPHFKPLVMVAGSLRPLSEKTYAAVVVDG